MEPDDAAIASEVQAERARVFNQRAVVGALTSPLGFLLLAWALYQISNLTSALCWLTLILGVEAVILFIAKRFQTLDATSGKSCPWARAQIYFSGAAGVAWGSSVLFIPAEGHLLGYLATVTILVGVMGYSIITMCLYRAATWSYFGGIFVVLMVQLLLSENPLKNVIAIGFCAQFTAQILGAGSLRAMMVKDIESHVRNQALVQLMSQAREQLEQVHNDVQAKNTQLNTAIAQLNELVAHDQLTGAYSRRYMLEQMERLAALHQRHGQPVCLIMLDLDHFKNINDHYGHPVGDRALVAVVKAVGAELRDGDMLGRLGGEEFLALMPMTDLESAMLLAERLRATLAEVVFTAGPHSMHLPASFGVAQLAPLESVNAWFRRVDDALYQAKTQGRNAVVAARTEATAPTPLGQPRSELAQG